MKILVTGASGFIGSRLCELLSDKGAVFSVFNGDLIKTETFPNNDFNIIIHLAAKITHLNISKNNEIKKTNILGTKNLINFYPNAKIVYISTTDVTRSVLSFYAETKLEAEKLISKNKTNLIIRLPSVFGPNQVQDKLIPRLIRHYYLGEKCNIINNNCREYIFIDDVCNKIIENLDNFGLITLDGIKIRNLRLSEIIKNIHAGKEMVDLSASELKLWRQLIICCQAFNKKEK